MLFSMFKEEDGLCSMRRVLAFLYALCAITCLIFCLVKGYEWKIILASVGLPSFVSIVLLFFTTWTDLSTTIKSIRGKGDINE